MTQKYLMRRTHGSMHNCIDLAIQKEAIAASKQLQ